MHLALVGPTASGKSAIALRYAELEGDVELVSIDSMQVYRGMDIGTAKPTAEEQGQVRHHLIDLVDPDQDFSLAEFREAYDAVMADIAVRGKRALLVGGTGLYFQVLVDRLELPDRYPEIRAQLEAGRETSDMYRQLSEFDPSAAEKMEPTNRRRIVRALEVCLGSGRPFSSFGPGMTAFPDTEIALFGLRMDRELLNARIAQRYEQQMAAGFLSEVTALAGPDRLGVTASQALGYKELLAVVRGDATVEDALQKAVFRTRRFARRQERWFRRDPRIRWIETSGDAEAGALELQRLSGTVEE